MNDVITLAFVVPVEYGTGTRRETDQFTLPTTSRQGLCQGRVQPSHSYRSIPCKHKANRTLTGVRYYGSQRRDDEPDEIVTVHVCGNHDTVAKATRKAEKARRETAERDRQSASREQLKVTLEGRAAQINAICGKEVVHVEFRSYGYGQTGFTYEMKVRDPAALADQLARLHRLTVGAL